MYRFASSGEIGEPCGMLRRLSRASVVRVFLPRSSVSSTAHSSHILIRCSTRRSTIRRDTDFCKSECYALDGYVSQTIPVRLIPAVKSALIDLTPSSLDPNPVFVTLEPARPPPPSKPPPVQRRQRQQPPPVPPTAAPVLPWPALGK